MAHTLWAAIGCLVTLAWGVASDRLAAAEERQASLDDGGGRRPNIVFLLIDDMGWPDLGCYGHAFHETPRMDRLAAEGVRFTDFYAASPVCSSTRASIQSGQYPARVGITDFIPGHWRPFEKLIVPEIDDFLPESIETPGDLLQRAGYATGYFGKWHLGPETTHGPRHYGYQVTRATLGPAFAKSREGRAAGPKQIDLLTDQTLWFIEQNRDQPFFVTLSHHAVHIPVQARGATVARFEAKPKPAEGVNHPVYAAMIADLDHSVGRILDRLETLGLTRDTLVILASDNGGLRQIYTGVGDVVSTNAPLRDEKGTLYEGGVRVPCVVRWPGVVPGGQTCDEPVTTADLLPTLVEVAGAPQPTQVLDGTSLVPLCQEPNSSLSRNAIFFHYPHYHHSQPAGAIRRGHWKLLEFYGDERVELYDLEDDLGEQHNRAPEQPDLVEALREQLADWRKDVAARMPRLNPEYDPARAAQWWNRRTGQPLDVEALRRRYEARSRD